MVETLNAALATRLGISFNRATRLGISFEKSKHKYTCKTYTRKQYEAVEEVLYKHQRVYEELQSPYNYTLFVVPDTHPYEHFTPLPQSFYFYLDGEVQHSPVVAKPGWIAKVESCYDYWKVLSSDGTIRNAGYAVGEAADSNARRLAEEFEKGWWR